MSSVEAALARLNEFIVEEGPQRSPARARHTHLAPAPAKLILQGVQAAERTRIALLVDYFFELDPERGEVDGEDLKAWIADRLTVAQVRARVEALRAKRRRAGRR